jgi:HlyD family secretion protein
MIHSALETRVPVSARCHEHLREMKELKRRSRLATSLAVLGLLLAGACWLLVSWLGRPKPIEPEKIVRAERGDIARAVVAVGRIEPLSKVEVKSKANGIIQSLAVDVGDKVAEGQVLAELDKEYLAAQVREARATKDAEEANLQVAIATEVKAGIEAANPELEFARRDHERLKKLFGEKIASQQALDEAEKQYEMSANRRELLEAAARTAAALVTQMRARVAAAQAAFERAEEDFRNTTIRSPINGMVLTRDREVGDAVSSILNLGSAATLIMTLGDVSSVYVEGQVDEADVGKIRIGLPVRTTVESFRGETFAGTVTRIAPMGRQKENVTTFDVRVSIANPQGKLRVNMSANAEIVLEDRKHALLIPEVALVRDKEGKAFVQRREVSSKTGFRKIPVKTGISNGQRTEVLEGLGEGAELVLP